MTSRSEIAARKALMAADPHYHAWSADQQERFRATMDAAARSRANAVLLQDVLGIDCRADDAARIMDDLSIAQLCQLNEAKLLTTGIGEDFVFLNESMATNTSLLDFPTLHDHDYAGHLYQEQANRKEFADYPGREYFALRFSQWVRLLVNGRLHYGTLYSLAGYLMDVVEDKGMQRIDTLIPHQYVEGKNHGKAEAAGFLWDMRIDAGGQEAQLDELKRRWFAYVQQRWLELSQSFVSASPAMFMMDRVQDDDPHRDFIFNNATALKAVRWKHLLADCARLRADPAELFSLEQHEIDRAVRWLDQAHEDIQHNFDPRVVPLQKRRKIIIAPGAFDGLADDDTPA